jgi:hypothetical protein
LIGATARALLCAGFILVLPVFDLETARHSVHHLASPDAGCLLASIASEVSAVPPDGLFAVGIAPDPIGAAPGLDLPRRPDPPAADHPGRAPPAPALG